MSSLGSARKLHTRSLGAFAWAGGGDVVVPFGVEVVAGEGDGGELFVGDDGAGRVVAVVGFGVDA